MTNTEDKGVLRSVVKMRRLTELRSGVETIPRPDFDVHNTKYSERLVFTPQGRLSAETLSLSACTAASMFSTTFLPSAVALGSSIG